MDKEQKKEQFIELIIESVDGCARNWAEIIADHLIKNGVIIPPVQVGQTVYRIWEEEPNVRESTIIYLSMDHLGSWIGAQNVNGGAIINHRVCEIGKTVFLTREEAEAAVKGAK